MSWFIGRASTPDVIDPNDPTGPLIPGPDKYFTTDNGEEVTRDLNDSETDTRYYLIEEINNRNIDTSNATLKAGPRRDAGELEWAETESPVGTDVAEAEVRR